MTHKVTQEYKPSIIYLWNYFGSWVQQNSYLQYVIFKFTCYGSIGRTTFFKINKKCKNDLRNSITQDLLTNISLLIKYRLLPISLISNV